MKVPSDFNQDEARLLGAVIDIYGGGLMQPPAASGGFDAYRWPPVERMLAQATRDMSIHASPQTRDNLANLFAKLTAANA